MSFRTKIFALTMALALPSLAFADAEPASGAAEIDGAMEVVLCNPDGATNVWDEKISEVQFRSKPYEQIKVFQGWGDNLKKKELAGSMYSFAKVQFPYREDEDKSIGWVNADWIKPRAQCAGANKKKEEESNEDGQDESSALAKITSLSDPHCCGYPLHNLATDDYTNGSHMSSFGYRRSHGKRLHAACDLYDNQAKVFTQYDGEKQMITDDAILAVAPGTVLRRKYKFYEGTYALEVKHAGGFVVRYGEIAALINGKLNTDLAKKMKAIQQNQTNGSPVHPGQTIAYMAKVNSGCCTSMLHFELYKGTLMGVSLNQPGNKYQRRKDLLNPTEYLREWERKAGLR